MSKPEPSFSARQPFVQRLFFALWPPAALQDRVVNYGQSLAAETAGHPVPRDKLHMTLLFLGPVSEEAQSCLEQSVAEQALPSFELSFGRLVYRHRQRMIWLQPDSPPDALQMLVSGLRQIAADCGLSTDPRPFCAHMTLLSRIDRAPATLPRPDFVWPVREFVLVASETLLAGAQYRIVKKWPLNGWRMNRG